MHSTEHGISMHSEVKVILSAPEKQPRQSNLLDSLHLIVGLMLVELTGCFINSME